MQKILISLRSRPLLRISATGIGLRSAMFLVLALGVMAPFSQHVTVSTNTDADPQQKGAAAPQSAGWTQQTSGTANNLFSVHFVNANEGWAVGFSNTILHTSNGGTSWSAQTNQGGVPVSSYLGVRFIDSNTGWAGGGAAIARTTDGGASWVSQGATQDGRFRNNLFAVSSTAAWIPTQNSTSSARWFSRFTVGIGEENFNVIGSSAQYADIYFTDADNGWSVGSGPIVRITQGSGGSPSFSFQTSCPCPTMNGIHMLDTSTGWAVGNGGLVLKTTNGGGTWISQTSGTTTNLRSVHFATATQGWAVGAGGLILMSTDGGASWTQETSGVTTELRRVFFVNANTGYAVGASGTILKRSVCTAPTIDMQPGNQTVCAGSSASFPVGASGTALTYQWRKGGVPLSNGGNITGANTATLTINPASTGDAGSYDVIITNSCGTATSDPATLGVNTAPSITDHPTSLTRCPGDPASFSVTATGSGLTYQWRKNTSPITGATSSSYSIASVAAGDAGSYDVVVSGVCNPSVASQAATLTVSVVTLSPASLPGGTAGTPYNQSLTASGGTGSYMFAVTAGTLPDGLALSSAGVISGTPSVTGGFNFTVTATDANNCTGSRNYAITITAQQTFTLTVSNAGGGTVTSNPSGVNCGATCSASYNSGTVVTLTATPDSGAVFAGWVGACTGAGSCMVTMNSDKAVTARFAFPLTVTKSGTGNGTITSNPVGINCGATCGASYDFGTIVTLSPTSDPGSAFTGWSGGCSGSGSCTVTMDAARSVTANFVQIMLSPATLSGGSVSVPYNQTIIASGGTAPYTFAITAGSLPPGLSLATMGALTGTPTAGGNYSFTVTATDAASITGSRGYTLTIDSGWKTTSSMNSARRFGTLTLLSNGKVLATGGIGGGASAESYDPNIGLWSATGSMSMGRYQHTATLLASGRVLVVGGYPNINSAELYNPTTGTWSSTGSLNQGRYEHTATLLPDGRVMVAGGFVAFVGPINSAEIYNPATGMWSSVNNMLVPREAPTATLLTNGKVLVAGGSGGDTIAELFDPSTGTWSRTANMNQARAVHTATLLPNGKVLVTGGASGALVIAAAEVFDPAGNSGAGSWTVTASLNIARRSHTASLLPNGKVLITGGFADPNTYFASTELFDPAGNSGQGSWSVSSNLNTTHGEHVATLLASGTLLVACGGSTIAELYNPAAGSWANTMAMAHRRWEHTATLLATGKVIVAGGFNSGNDFLTGAELYDPGTETWTSAGNMNTKRMFHTATLLPNGKVLVTGGFNIDGITNTAELYDPGTGMWSSTANMSTSRRDHTATLLPNGKVLIAGGGNSGGGTGSAELFDPAGNGGLGSWTPTGSMNASRGGTATLLPNGRVLVVGAGIGGPGLVSAELYDPATESWTSTPNMSTPRNGHTANLLANGKVLVAGGVTNVALASAELYDPNTGLWNTTGSMNTARAERQSAVLLHNGSVLVAGGAGGSSLASAELYDPATGLWQSTASMGDTRAAHTLTLLPGGKVLAAGGYNSSAYLDSAELYDVGLGFNNAWRPALTAVTSPLTLGSTLTASGDQFRGISEASSGGAQNSSTNYPLVQILSLANEQSLFLLSDPASNWSNTSFTSQPMPVLPPGYALVTVFTNGIPSTSRMTLINCSFVISPTSKSFTASGGSDSVIVSTSPACSWTAVTNSSFINVTFGGAGSGNGTVNYQVAANTGQSRIGTMTIAGYTFTVTQDACIAPSITTSPSNQTVCSGSSAIFAVVAAGTGITYRWRKGGMPLFDGGNISGATTDHLTINPAATGDAGSYDVVVSGACNPPATSMAATLTVNAPPQCSIDGPSSACPNQTNTFTGPFSNNLNYSWSISGNGTIFGSTTSPLVSVSTASAGSFTLTLMVTDTTTGCSSSCMKTVPIAAPTPCAITGADAVCAGSTGNTFTGPSGTLFSYVWFVSGNGSIAGGNIGQSVIVTASGAGSFTLTLNVTNANGCNSSCNKMVTVNPNPSIILDRDHQSFAANGGNGTIAVTASDAICPWTATTTSSFITINSGSPGAGNGTVQYSVAPNPNSTIRNGTITVGDQTFTIYQGINFADVPSNDLFYNDIGKLAARGVTVGCGNGNYCPNDPVTREQMAAFIMRAKGEFNPPPPSAQRFNDVPPQNVFYNFIDRMAVLGITVGCTPDHLMYCPSDPVKREQMSAFLLRGLGEFNPPTPSSQRFNDVPPQNVFYNFIDRLAVLQITLGCTPDHLMYCPNNSVTRAQMAAFLVRAFNL
jgi:photosystem II stability/assembly factor-like uncharacterized protein